MSTATAVKPVRLQRSRKKGSRLVSPNGLRIVNCARPTIFGNPFAGPGAVAAFRRYLTTSSQCEHIDGEMLKLKRIPSYQHWRDLRDTVPRLKGFNLLCWCRLCPKHRETGKPLNEHCPDCAPCHVDVLGELANASVSPTAAGQGVRQ